jgi:oligoribonuclease (3'-5' exoribonuclease)
MKKIIFLVICMVGFSCSHQGGGQQHVIMNYRDFGPPALASELIGNDYWQWDSHGDSRPRDYLISVVVYRNVDVQKVKKIYPVIKEKEQDYRYVEYQIAMEFLDSSIAELQSYKDEIPQKLIDTLTKTRNTIKSVLGNM